MQDLIDKLNISKDHKVEFEDGWYLTKAFPVSDFNTKERYGMLTIFEKSFTELNDTLKASVVVSDQMLEYCRLEYAWIIREQLKKGEEEALKRRQEKELTH